MDKTLSLDLQQTDFGRGLDKEIKRLDGRIDDETEARSAADQEIWTEIEAIEAASDVVDVVGTYAELEDYDTSALKDNDIIKVLADETHDDAIAYYRWNTSTEVFTFVGVEGPYYTASETDTLLADKQDKLIAGSNIQIASDGKTISATDTTYTAGTNIQINDNVISATDTTYSAFTGATSSVAGAAGLVPAPTTSDPDKFLKGDGTWGTISQYTPTVFYIDKNLPRYGSSSVSNVHVYKDSALTETASLQELYDAIDAGGATLVHLNSGLIQTYNFLFAIHSPHNGNPDSGGDYMYFAGDDGATLHTTDQSGQSTNDPAIFSVEVDGLYSVDVMRGATSGHAGYMGLAPTPASADRTKFLRGDGTWATPTDTTYSDFGGATSSAAGTAGLVPAPAAGDETKFLAGDGTWQTVSGGGGGSYSAGYGINIDANNEISADQTVLALRTDLVGKQDVLTAGSNITINGTTISATDTTYSAFTGATSSTAGTAGLVPGPLAGDEDKYLKGDGTWGTVSTGATVTEFYLNSYPGDATHVYKDSAMQTLAAASDINDALDDGPVRLVDGSYEYDVVAYNKYGGMAGNGSWNIDDGTEVYTMSFVDSTTLFWDSFNLQQRLTAGSNITIGADGVTISATDTTYSAFGGATSSVAGSAGLVPAPTTSDPDKFLKGDGTWSTLPAANNINTTDWNGLWQ